MPALCNMRRRSQLPAAFDQGPVWNRTVVDVIDDLTNPSWTIGCGTGSAGSRFCSQSVSRRYRAFTHLICGLGGM